MKKVIVIGAGPAGLTAAIYAARACLSVLVLEKEFVSGGQVVNTYEVDNYPGYRGISGFDLGMKFREHAEKLDVEFVMEAVERVDLEKEEKIIYTDQSEYHGRTVILAMGASHRKLEVRGEEDFSGMGVSYCAVCDAAFFEELEVAVIGGGNTAVEEACYLTGFASKVYLVHRRDQFRADKMVVDHALSNPKIVPVMDSVLESIEGSDIVEKIVVRNVKTNEKREIPLSGVFIFIGTLPNDEYVHDLLQKDEGGWIVTDASLQTSVPGIFAAGDVRDTSLRQVVTAAGDGARAAMSAYAYLQR